VSPLDGATSERAAHGESFTREAKVGAIWKDVYAKHDSTQAEENDHAEVKRSILSWEQKTSGHEDKRADQHQQHLLSTATKRDGKFHLTRPKISDRAGKRAWLQTERTNHMKATHRSGARFAASPG